MGCDCSGCQLREWRSLAWGVVATIVGWLVLVGVVVTVGWFFGKAV